MIIIFEFDYYYYLMGEIVDTVVGYGYLTPQRIGKGKAARKRVPLYDTKKKEHAGSEKSKFFNASLPKDRKSKRMTLP